MASRQEEEEEEEVNRFQSLITLSLANCGEKLSVGRSETGLEFRCWVYGFMSPAHTENRTEKNLNTSSFFCLDIVSA